MERSARVDTVTGRLADAASIPALAVVVRLAAIFLHVNFTKRRSIHTSVFWTA